MKKVQPMVLVFLIFAFIAAGSLLGYKMFFDQNVNQQHHLVVVLKSTDTSIEFWQTVKSGIETAAKEFDVSVSITGSLYESDVKGQIRILEKAIEEKPDGIILAASDYNALVPLAEEIVNKGIKLVCFDSGINSDVAESFVATDNILAGRQIGENLAGILQEDEKIAIVSHVKGSATAIEREQGFRQGLGEKREKNIIGTFFSNTSEDNAYRITVDLLTSHKEIKGIAGLNETSTVGAGKAIKDLGLSGKVTLVGFDSSIDEIKLIEAGAIQMTVVQKPFNIGYLSVKTAIDLLNGKKVSKRIDTGAQIITKENMYTIENQKLLFPFAE